MILQIYTIIHTLISLVAIFTGLVVLFGMLAGKRLDHWTKWFLVTALATTVTGFLFPFHGFTPAIGLGIISLPFLAVTILARCSKHLAGAWRWIYVVVAVICLYFNLFVFVVQLLISGIHETSEQGYLPFSNAIHEATEAWGPDSSFGHLLSYLLVILPVAWLVIKGLLSSSKDPKQVPQHSSVR